MGDLVLEIIRAIILAGILLFLWIKGKRQTDLPREGWKTILAGFGLLLLGSLVDISDNFESLNRFVIVGDTAAQAVLEKLVGFLGGFLLLGIGFARWLPRVASQDTLQKQVNKLDCMYAISKLIENPGFSLEELLQQAVETVSASWQYSDITGVQIVLGERCYRTAGFEETPWKQSATIQVVGEPIGSLEVCYLAKWSDSGVDSCRAEEQGLLDMIGKRLGKVIALRRMEDALRLSEQKFRSLFDASDDAMILIADGCFIDCNESTLNMLGYKSKKDFCGKHPTDISPCKQPDGSESKILAHQRITEAVQHGSSRFEWTHQRADGTCFPTEVVLNSLEIGGRQGFLGVVRDITERKDTEEQLQASETKLRAITESALDAVIMIDSKGKAVYWNPAAEQVFGYSAEEIIGSSIHAVLAPKHYREKASKGFSGFVKSGEGNAVGNLVELEAIRKDGVEIPIELSLSPVLMNGQWWAVAVVRDITERKKALREIEQSEQALTTIFESLPVGAVIVGKDKKIRKANKAALSLMGSSSVDGLLGKICYTKLCGRKARKCPIWDLGRTCETTESVLLTGTGQETPVIRTVLPITLAGEGVSLEVFVDISSQKQTEMELRSTADALEAANQALEEFNEVAETANRAKSEFLANMSHEIRTPMTAILGYSDVLLGEIERDSDRSAVHTIKRNGEYLLELINDILDLSKIEAGKLDVDRISCSPIQVVSEVASLMRVRAEAKNLPLEIEYAGPIPESIHCDPVRLRQILVNLMGNAIKFTETGCVRLLTRFIQRSDGLSWLQFDVIDTGIGMTQEQIRKLFKPFMQADSTTSRKFGGTGLGLSISKRLAKLLGGDISVSSTLGKGSTFSVTIETGALNGVQMLDDPARLATEGRQEPKPAAAPKVPLDCRILLAEDGPDNQRLISFVLKKAGARVTVVENGQEACEQALAAKNEGRPFEVVLMDMQMPVMDGYTATQELREAGYDGPIIALTANAMLGDDEKCREVGCDDYLTKPIDRTQFLPLIASYAQQPSPDVEVGDTPSLKAN